MIDVEVPFELSAARIRIRWERAYASALEGGDSLGGRWVPSEYARSVYERSYGRSKSEVAARRLAEQCPAVSRFKCSVHEWTKRRSRRSHQRLMLICPALGMGQGLLILKRSPSQTECRATQCCGRRGEALRRGSRAPQRGRSMIEPRLLSVSLTAGRNTGLPVRPRPAPLQRDPRTLPTWVYGTHYRLFVGT